MNANREKFKAELTAAYARLFESDPETYGMARARYSPAELAAKMTAGLADGSANKDADGVRAACKACGIRNTYRDIKAFLAGGAP